MNDVPQLYNAFAQWTTPPTQRTDLNSSSETTWKIKSFHSQTASAQP